MATRPLEDEWPALVDSTGTPGTGTRVNKSTFDDVHDAIDTAIYDPNLDEGPPEIASEVVTGRGAYSSLSARLEAIESAAAGGAAGTNLHPGVQNLVRNDGFLVWADEAANAAPTLWNKDAGFTSLTRATYQGSARAEEVFGRNTVLLQNPDTTPRAFYIDVVSAAQLASYGAVPIKNAYIGAGCYLYCSDADAADVYVFDGVTEHQVGEQGATVNAWVWSGSGGTYDGGATMGAAAAQLTLRIKIKKASSVYVASPALVFGADTLTRWPGPAPVRTGQWVWGAADDGQIATGVKAYWYPPNPAFIFNSRLWYKTGSGTNTYTLKKGSSTIETLSVTGGATDSGAQKPPSVVRGSVAGNNLLEIANTVADASARGPMVQVNYIELLDPLAAAFGGSVVI
jgi:hypothetical protein